MMAPKKKKVEKVETVRRRPPDRPGSGRGEGWKQKDAGGEGTGAGGRKEEKEVEKGRQRVVDGLGWGRVGGGVKGRKRPFQCLPLTKEQDPRGKNVLNEGAEEDCPEGGQLPMKGSSTDRPESKTERTQKGEKCEGITGESESNSHQGGILKTGRRKIEKGQGSSCTDGRGGVPGIFCRAAGKKVAGAGLLN